MRLCIHIYIYCFYEGRETASIEQPTARTRVHQVLCKSVARSMDLKSEHAQLDQGSGKNTRTAQLNLNKLSVWAEWPCNCV